MIGRPKLDKNKGNCSKGCDKIILCRSLCRNCYDRLNYEEHERQNLGRKRHVKHSLGTIRTDKSGYQRIKIGEGKGCRDWMKYHKFLMEKKLDRKLHPYESVHHKNGKKDDNRLSNLELWVTKQPKGQRPKDLVKYAKWILKTYSK